MRKFCVVLRSFCHSCLLYTFYCHPSPPSILIHFSSLHLAIRFLVCLSGLLFLISYIILFWEIYFLPCPTTTIYVGLMYLLQWDFKKLHTYLYKLISFSFVFYCHTGPKILLYIFLPKKVDFLCISLC
jgi:hypothetical protein